MTTLEIVLLVLAVLAFAGGLAVSKAIWLFLLVLLVLAIFGRA